MSNKSSNVVRYTFQTKDVTLSHHQNVWDVYESEVKAAAEEIPCSCISLVLFPALSSPNPLFWRLYWVGGTGCKGGVSEPQLRRGCILYSGCGEYLGGDGQGPLLLSLAAACLLAAFFLQPSKRGWTWQKSNDSCCISLTSRTVLPLPVLVKAG